MNYKQALEELYSMKEWKFRLGLKNMRVLLKKLGNPEKKLKCIHVTGTNGKGSVCSMISSILIDSGYNVGMYTSPHLKKFNERIRINNHLKKKQDLNSTNKGIRGGIKGSYPIYGGYQTFNYCSWAAKFLIDALLLEEKLK